MSLWPVIAVYLLPQLIKTVYVIIHKSRKPGFYQKLAGGEVQAYTKRQEGIKKQQQRA